MHGVFSTAYREIDSTKGSSLAQRLLIPDIEKKAQHRLVVFRHSA